MAVYSSKSCRIIGCINAAIIGSDYCATHRTSIARLRVAAQHYSRRIGSLLHRRGKTLAMGGARCKLCGYFVPYGEKSIKIWPPVCNQCGGTLELIPEKVGFIKKELAIGKNKLSHLLKLLLRPARVGLFRKLFKKGSEPQPKTIEQLFERSGCVEHLIRDLTHSDFNTRREAAKSLGNAKDTRATEALIKALHDSETSVRMSAANSLGKIGDMRGRTPLIEALDDDYNFVRSFAISALVELLGRDSVDVLIEAMHREVERVVKADAAGYGLKFEGTRVRIQTWPEVEKELRDPYNSAKYVLVEIIKKLGGLADSRVVPHLIKVLNNNVVWHDPGIWSYIFETFGKIGDKRPIQHIAPALNIENEGYRKLASTVLGEIGGQEAVDVLNRALISENSMIVKEAIKGALEKAKRRT